MPDPTLRPAALFDLDGTLCDSTYLHALAWRRAFVAHGLDVPTAWAHLHIGMGSGQLLGELAPDADDDLRAALKATSRARFRELRPEVRAFPGAAQLLRAVHDRGVAVVLATSSEEEDLEAHRAALDADDAIDAVTSAGDVDEAKPEPEVFRVAMEQVGATTAVVVGDTVWDVQAAARCDLACVGVRTGGIAEPVLRAAGAVAVYEDVAALLDQLDTSPLARLWS